MRRVRPPSWSLGLALVGLLLSCADGVDGGGPDEPEGLVKPISDWPDKPIGPVTGVAGGGPGGTQEPDPGEMPPTGPGATLGGSMSGPGGGGTVGGAAPGGVADAGSPSVPAMDAAAPPADAGGAVDIIDAGDAGVVDAALADSAADPG